jgi:hypothetical protein
VRSSGADSSSVAAIIELAEKATELEVPLTSRPM